MQEHLIIDGNNALHAIPELAVEFAKDRNIGRESLLHYMEPLQTMENNLLTVVFDGRQGKGRIYQHNGIKNYTVIYSSSKQGADGVIERMLLAAKYPEIICVATNDNQIRNCAYESGASTIKIEELLKKLDYSIDRQKLRFKKNPLKKSESLPNRIEFPDFK